MASMPENERVYRSYKGQGLVLIGVHLDPDIKQRDAIIKEKGVTYPVCEDKSPTKPGGAATAYHIEYIPTIFVIDRKGKIVAVEPPDLEKAVKKALASK
ncbi:MAG TPA: TlpA disulfide reductase family protein [Fimbriimonadaceae bacterium]|nr:TlpA disulfide reductase family protein [Fimbriimonadaceae bacterium]